MRLCVAVGTRPRRRAGAYSIRSRGAPHLQLYMHCDCVRDYSCTVYIGVVSKRASAPRLVQYRTVGGYSRIFLSLSTWMRHVRGCRQIP